MPKTALITGSTGFIGSQLCRELLAAGYQVRAFHRPTSSLTLLQGLDVDHALGDITQPATLATAMKGIDVVFHTASKVDYWRGEGGLYPVTVGGTCNVLQAALEAKVHRVVYTSSAAALGITGYAPPNNLPPLLMNETHVWNLPPRSWRYGHAKYLAEMEVQKAVARGLDCVIVNPTMVLGPGDINRISGEIIVQAVRGLVRFWTSGGLNAIHIDDVVRGHILALERGQMGERYILGGENQTFIDFFQTVTKIVGARPPQFFIPAWLLRPAAGPLDLLCHVFPLPFNGNILRFSGHFLYYDTNKAQQELGLIELRSVRTALQDTYDWYRARGMI
jgi:dihydroflavonol-4-reductase